MVLSKQVFRCCLIYSESSMLRIYIEGLHEFIWCAVRTYWSEHPKADIDKLARHTNRVANLTGNTKTGTADGHAFDIE